METFEDILSEMRRRADLGLQIIGVDLRQFTDRFEVAAKQMEIQRIADIARECTKVKAECDAENARLRDAVKPVVSCVLGSP